MVHIGFLVVITEEVEDVGADSEEVGVGDSGADDPRTGNHRA